eukprot:SAG31_NODE_1011_length_10382_cov_8.910240_5_plen_231_part_00
MEPKLHRSLVKQYVLKPLVQALAEAESPQTRSFAGKALVSLAVTTDEKKALIVKYMVDAGAFKALRAQMEDADSTVASLGFDGLRRICRAGGSALQQMDTLGAVDRLFDCLQQATSENTSSSVDAARHYSVLTAIANLGKAEDDSAQIGKKLLATAFSKETGTTMVDAVVRNLANCATKSDVPGQTAALDLLGELAKIEPMEDVLATHVEVIVPVLPLLLRGGESRCVPS